MTILEAAKYKQNVMGVPLPPVLAGEGQWCSKGELTVEGGTDFILLLFFRWKLMEIPSF